MDKKGQGISMTYIIIAALTLVVLVVIIMFFTGGLQSLFEKQTTTVEGSIDQQLEIWRNQCKLYCTMEKNKLGNCPNFCNYKPGKNNEFYSCQGNIEGTKSLDISCESSLIKETPTNNLLITIASPNEEGDKCDCTK